MEKQSVDQLIREYLPNGEFKPCAFYSREADALTFYFRNEPDYAQRLHSRVTIYRSLDTDKLIGCRIKNVGRVLEDLGQFPVNIELGKDQLSMLFIAFRGDVFESDDAREIWKTLIEESNKADAKIPELA